GGGEVAAGRPAAGDGERGGGVGGRDDVQRPAEPGIGRDPVSQGRRGRRLAAEGGASYAWDEGRPAAGAGRAGGGFRERRRGGGHVRGERLQVAAALGDDEPLAG